MKSSTTNCAIYPTQNMWYNNSVSKSCDKRALSVFTSHSLCIAQRVSHVQNYIFKNIIIYRNLAASPLASKDLCWKGKISLKSSKSLDQKIK